jgi:hypothetical protein
MLFSGISNSSTQNKPHTEYLVEREKDLCFSSTHI